MLELDGRSLVEARPPQDRVVGVCRHFTTFSCALLRSKGIPARSRCGFGTYFEAGKFIDHWIVEYWDRDDARWIGVDTQMVDDVQTAALGLDFDPSDVPADRFLIGGRAWQMARDEGVDPDRFGIYTFWGWGMLRDNLVRDIAALNKVELLPWDTWGVMHGKPKPTKLGDALAVASRSGDLDAVRSGYAHDDVRVPVEIFSQRLQQPATVPTGT